jgi:hypothetical protein
MQQLSLITLLHSNAFFLPKNESAQLGMYATLVAAGLPQYVSAD